MKDPWPITLDECAERLHVKRRRLREYLNDHPHYHKLGRTFLFFEDDYQALVASLAAPLPQYTLRRKVITRIPRREDYGDLESFVEAKRLLKNEQKRERARYTKETSREIELRRR